MTKVENMPDTSPFYIVVCVAGSNIFLLRDEETKSGSHRTRTKEYIKVFTPFFLQHMAELADIERDTHAVRRTPHTTNISYILITHNGSSSSSAKTFAIAKRQKYLFLMSRAKLVVSVEVKSLFRLEFLLHTHQSRQYFQLKY